jgi:TfuA protein
MATCVVFLGPSLSHDEARRIVGEDCELRPPVKRGDLPSLSASVSLVAIIDGVFQSESAVGHREILEQMKKGVEVVGGGSMGALRASELDSMGMLGIGEVYELYAQKKIDGDDEVALIFNPENLEALSEPLVNTRQNLQRAEKMKLISGEEADLLLHRMKEIFYPKRTRERLLEEAKRALNPSSLSKFEKFVRDEYIDVKMKDAKKVLRYVIKSRDKRTEINK